MLETKITCDLTPYNCIQPPPIKYSLPVFIYVWEDVIGYSNTPPGKSDRTLINEGYLYVIHVIGSDAYACNSNGELYKIDQAVDYGDYHSIEAPF